MGRMTYEHFLEFEFNEHLNAWLCERADKKYAKGVEIIKFMQDFFPDNAEDLLRIVTQVDFHQITFLGIRIRATPWLIRFEYNSSTFRKGVQA